MERKALIIIIEYSSFLTIKMNVESSMTMRDDMWVGSVRDQQDIEAECDMQSDGNEEPPRH